jgi:3-hydroxyisobutyrate dehydrogenase-like beta-hydroxyacid dehydrogenase
VRRAGRGVTVVGLVGTGRMGSAMARALSRAGLSLIVWNRTPGPAEALAAELGARAVASAAEAAAGSDVCLTMVADEAAVEAVFVGPRGLFEGARPGGVLVDLSTVPPGMIRSFADRAREAGVGLLDAPVSGSVGRAEAGQLTLMVGGEAGDLERARPALEPLARTIFHLGPLGSGACMKLAVNTVIGGLNLALAEGLVLAERSGIDRSLAYDVIAASAAGAPFVAYKRAAFLEPDTTPTAFSLALAEKDLRLILDLAAALGVPVPGATATLAVLRATAEHLGADRDFSAVASHLAASAIARPAGPSADGGGGHTTDER